MAKGNSVNYGPKFGLLWLTDVIHIDSCSMKPEHSLARVCIEHLAILIIS